MAVFRVEKTKDFTIMSNNLSINLSGRAGSGKPHGWDGSDRADRSLS